MGMIPDWGDDYPSRRPDEDEPAQPDEEEEYLHRHCDGTAVFWQDGVAHCMTCGKAYPPYEPVTLY